MPKMKFETLRAALALQSSTGLNQFFQEQQMIARFPSARTKRTRQLPRVFNPGNLFLLCPLTVQGISIFSQESQLSNIVEALPENHFLPAVDFHTIIVGCYSVMTSAFSTDVNVGISFGPWSKYNSSKRMAGNELCRYSTIDGQFLAAYRALKKAFKISKLPCPVTSGVYRIVVATESEVLVRLVNEQVVQRDGRAMFDPNGDPIEGVAGLRRLNKLLNACEAEGLVVDFWAVGRNQLAGAEALALRAAGQGQDMSPTDISSTANGSLGGSIMAPSSSSDESGRIGGKDSSSN